MTGARLAAVGTALPHQRITNDAVAAPLELDDAWIRARTGIVERRRAAPEDSAASLGASAAARCLAAAGVDPADVDVTICATVTPDLRFPATACLIQAALGAGGAAYDLNAGCSGFLFALAQADALVRSGSAARVLVIGSEVLSRITDPTDRGTAILFGDGAGAVLVETAAESTLGPFSLHSDGSRPDLLYVPPDLDVIRMQGREIYRLAVAGMTSAAREAIAAGTTPGSIDLLVAHQANARILEAVAERLGLGPDRIFTNIERLGNTSAASIPIALHDAAVAGRVTTGTTVLLAAFGAGLCWGAATLTWSDVRLPSEERMVAAHV